MVLCSAFIYCERGRLLEKVKVNVSCEQLKCFAGGNHDQEAEVYLVLEKSLPQAEVEEVCYVVYQYLEQTVAGDNTPGEVAGTHLDEPGCMKKVPDDKFGSQEVGDYWSEETEDDCDESFESDDRENSLSQAHLGFLPGIRSTEGTLHSDAKAALGNISHLSSSNLLAIGRL